MYQEVEETKALALKRLHHALQSRDYATMAKLSKTLDKNVKHTQSIKDTALQLVRDMSDSMGGFNATKTR